MRTDYDKLIGAMRKCSGCALRDKKHPPLLPELPILPVPIMFVGENPSWAPDLQSPLDPRSISGDALEQNYLRPLGLARYEVWVTNLCKCCYPRDGDHSATADKKENQEAAAVCARLWLLPELDVARPFVLVTLSDQEVYQPLRRIFKLPVPANFSEAVGRPHPVRLDKIPVVLFPMVHPDVSRPVGEGDHRKLPARLKWAGVHADEHIPALKRFLETIQ